MPFLLPTLENKIPEGKGKNSQKWDEHIALQPETKRNRRPETRGGARQERQQQDHKMTSCASSTQLNYSERKTVIFSIS